MSVGERIRRARAGAGILLLLCLAASLAAAPAAAQGGASGEEEDDWGGAINLGQDTGDDAGDDWGGGLGIDVEEDAGDAGGPRRSFWSLDGFLRLDTAYAYQQQEPVGDGPDYRGLSKLRGTVQLELNLDFGHRWSALISGQASHDAAYGLKERDRFTDEVLDRYEQEAEFRETYVRGTLLDDLDLKVGRQIVVWGYADQLRVVDVLNPLDNREPGLVDIEDLRLPLTMTRVSYYLGDWSLNAVAVHEIRFNKDPVYNSEFFPFSQPLPEEEIPPDGGENTEYGLWAQAVLSGWDIAFYWARIFDDTPHVEVELEGFVPKPRLVHSRLTMLGSAVRVALGNWLIKGEVARIDGLEFAALPDETRSRWDVLGGLEYSGIRDTTITLEALNRHIVDFDDVLEGGYDNALENVNQYALSYRGDFLNQTLHAVAVWLAFGETGNRGTVQRYSLTYDVIDALAVTGGVLVFQSGDKANFLLDHGQDSDRVFADVKYSF